MFDFLKNKLKGALSVFSKKVEEAPVEKEELPEEKIEEVKQVEPVKEKRLKEEAKKKEKKEEKKVPVKEEKKPVKKLKNCKFEKKLLKRSSLKRPFLLKLLSRKKNQNLSKKKRVFLVRSRVRSRQRSFLSRSFRICFGMWSLQCLRIMLRLRLLKRLRMT